MANDTAWHHPMHLHGHAFRVLSRNGEPTRLREWQDTMLLAPRERVEITFVADNPGDWMFHCHILEHLTIVPVIAARTASPPWLPNAGPVFIRGDAPGLASRAGVSHLVEHGVPRTT